MLAKTVTYEDYDGKKRTETFYFNLNKTELMKWLTTSGDYTLDKVLERLIETNNVKEQIEIMESMLKLSYGKKSLDGRIFEKSEEIWKEFRYSEAYSEVFFEIMSSGKSAADFVNGVIPKALQEEIVKIIKENPEGIPDSLKDYVPDLVEVKQ